MAKPMIGLNIRLHAVIYGIPQSSIEAR